MTETSSQTPPLRLLVDADACPVREECVRVALRHEVKVTFVSNSHFRIEQDPLVEREIVPGNFDAADDRIVEYQVGEARVRLDGRERTALVVFGPEGSAPLLGATTLQLFNLAVDSTRERLFVVPALLK